MSGKNDVDAMIHSAMQRGQAQQLNVASPLNDMQLVALMAAQVHALNPSYTAEQCVADCVELLAHSIARLNTLDLKARVMGLMAEYRAKASALKPEPVGH